MAYRKVILAEAQQEYRDIVGYLVSMLRSEQAARNFMEEFDKQVNLVAENPELYGLSRVPELAERGYRCAPMNNYIALYKVADGQIVVCRIVHKSRDYARLLEQVAIAGILQGAACGVLFAAKSYNLVDGPIARDASVRPWYHDAMLKRPSSGKKAL